MKVKNLSGLEDATFTSRDQSPISRFLNSSWLSEYANDQRVEEAINFASKKAEK